MTYQITAYCKGRQKVTRVRGVKELHDNLGQLRSKGYVVADIQRAAAVVR